MASSFQLQQQAAAHTSGKQTKTSKWLPLARDIEVRLYAHVPSWPRDNEARVRMIKEIQIALEGIEQDDRDSQKLKKVLAAERRRKKRQS